MAISMIDYFSLYNRKVGVKVEWRENLQSRNLH